MSGGNSALSGANGNTELGEEQIKGEELPSVWSTLKNFDLKKSLEQSPCMRRGLLSGMVAGFAVGGIQYARTRKYRNYLEYTAIVQLCSRFLRCILPSNFRNVFIPIETRCVRPKAASGSAE
eukprot:Nk52_evm19s164 gene=Nk52_evmTU19s164